MSNRRKLKTQPTRLASPAMQQFSVRAAAAESLYAREEAAFERRFEDTKADFAERLRDPAANEELGLPSELPDETIRILAFTQTLDQVGPDRPNKIEIYERLGLSSDPFALARAKARAAAARAEAEAHRVAADR